LPLISKVVDVSNRWFQPRMFSPGLTCRLLIEFADAVWFIKSRINWPTWCLNFPNWQGLPNTTSSVTNRVLWCNTIKACNVFLDNLW
jgi:hypothetical protein